MKADEVLDQPKKFRMKGLVSQFLKIFKMSGNLQLHFEVCQERIFTVALKLTIRFVRFCIPVITDESS